MSQMISPVGIDHVTLVVHDLPTTGAFYEQALGLERLYHTGTEAGYGAGGTLLVALRADPSARRASSFEPGLFHTAFLLPTRADLAAWIGHMRAKGIAVQGAADHLVSEAFYLSDPEGNGIEVYADRPGTDWVWHAGQVQMTTQPLDMADLERANTGPWQGAPAHTVVGHVHLQVGAIDPAIAFYTQHLGLQRTTGDRGVQFFGWNGYHHHIATNVWYSRGAGPKSMPATGLSHVALRMSCAMREDLRARTHTPLVDPWGLEFTLKAH
ncbi:VOC family protein [Rhodobacteraceae bacterium]|nr:VOC family protein [Paracoccaceae bacterium]